MSAVAQGWHVARREMRERSRSRGFRIGFVLMLLVVIVMVVVPGMRESAEESKSVGVAGTTSAMAERTLSDRGASDDIAVNLVRFGSVSAGQAALRDEEIDVLVVDGRRLEAGHTRRHAAGSGEHGHPGRGARDRAAAAGVDETTVHVCSPVPVENVEVGAVSGRTADDDAAVALMTVVLLAAIVIYGNPGPHRRRGGPAVSSKSSSRVSRPRPCSAGRWSVSACSDSASSPSPLPSRWSP